MLNRRTERFYENIILVGFIVTFSFLLHDALIAKAFKVNGMQSMTFPKGIFVLMIALCSIKFIFNILEIIKERNNKCEFNKLHPIKLLTLLFIIVYALLWNIIGFGLSSVLFITLESKLLRRSCSWLKAILVGLGSTVFIYIVFGLCFKVDFPEPILELIF